MKKSELIETLKAMSDNCYALAKAYREDGHEDKYHLMMREVCAIDNTISMMEKPSYARKIRAIYFPG